MSEKKPIVNDDEGIKKEPEKQTDQQNPDAAITNEPVDPASDDTGGTTPPANKPRG